MGSVHIYVKSSFYMKFQIAIGLVIGYHHLPDNQTRIQRLSFTHWYGAHHRERRPFLQDCSGGLVTPSEQMLFEPIPLRDSVDGGEDLVK